jgi:hypothetical protein
MVPSPADLAAVGLNRTDLMWPQAPGTALRTAEECIDAALRR